MTIDHNGSIHDDSNGRFTGAARHESDPAQVLPPAPAWHAELRGHGYLPGLDSVPVAAAMVLDFEVVVHDDHLVTLSRKRLLGSDIEFTFWDHGQWSTFTVPATSEITVIRAKLRLDEPIAPADETRTCTCGALQFTACLCGVTVEEFDASRRAKGDRHCTCGAHYFTGCFCGLTLAEFMASPNARGVRA